jgi:hypothetical protein
MTVHGINQDLGNYPRLGQPGRTISYYSASMAEADGQLYRVTQDMLQLWGFREEATVRLTIGTLQWLNWKNELDAEPGTGRSFDLDKMLASHFAIDRWVRLGRVVTRGMIVHQGASFVEVGVACKERGHAWRERFYAALDTSSGSALHIMTPSEY